MSRQLALARLDEALRRAEEPQRGDEPAETDASVPAQRNASRAAQLMHTLFQASPGGRDRDR